MPTKRTHKGTSRVHFAHLGPRCPSLLAAEPSFLASNKRNILAAMSELDPTLQDDVADRISDSRLDVDERWDTFVHLVQDDRLPVEIDDFYDNW